MEFVTLLGTEDVARAGSNMCSAASEMSRAVSSMDESLRNHQRFMDDWLVRFEEIMGDEGVRGKLEEIRCCIIDVENAVDSHE